MLTFKKAHIFPIARLTEETSSFLYYFLYFYKFPYAYFSRAEHGYSWSLAGPFTWLIANEWFRFFAVPAYLFGCPIPGFKIGAAIAYRKPYGKTNHDFDTERIKTHCFLCV